jgi:hypothetical protein
MTWFEHGIIDMVPGVQIRIVDGLERYYNTSCYRNPN